MIAKLHKHERLKSRITFQDLFRKGGSLRFKHLNLRYLPHSQGESILQVAFTVPKKAVRKAVDRNRIKRQMRSVFRELKPNLYERMEEHGLRASFLFIHHANTPLEIETVDQAMRTLVLRWIKEQTSHAQ